MKSHSRSLMLVAVALVASMGLAACQKPTTSVAGSTSVADSTSVAPSASASASVSTAPVVKSYYVTVDDTQDMKVVVSTGKAVRLRKAKALTSPSSSPRLC